jgi:hypothetical protein
MTWQTNHVVETDQPAAGPRSLLPELESRTTKEQSMRTNLPAEQELEEGPQTVYFQIANGNAFQPCSVTTKFLTQQQASRYLRQNWNNIEKMARNCMVNGTFGNGRIKLVML